MTNDAQVNQAVANFRGGVMTHLKNADNAEMAVSLLETRETVYQHRIRQYIHESKETVTLYGAMMDVVVTTLKQEQRVRFRWFVSAAIVAGFCLGYFIR